MKTLSPADADLHAINVESNKRALRSLARDIARFSLLRDMPAKEIAAYALNTMPPNVPDEYAMVIVELCERVRTK